MKEAKVINYIMTEDETREMSSLDREKQKLILSKLKLLLVRAEVRR